MKNLSHEDEMQRLREQLRLRIDTAMQAITEALHTAADLFLAIACRTPGARDSGGNEQVKVDRFPELMTTQQAADYLGVKNQTLGTWRSVKRYALPFVKVGRNVRYRKSDLDKFIRSRTKNHGGEVGTH